MIINVIRHPFAIKANLRPVPVSIVGIEVLHKNGGILRCENVEEIIIESIDIMPYINEGNRNFSYIGEEKL